MVIARACVKSTIYIPFPFMEGCQSPCVYKSRPNLNVCMDVKWQYQDRKSSTITRYLAAIGKHHCRCPGHLHVAQGLVSGERRIQMDILKCCHALIEQVHANLIPPRRNTPHVQRGLPHSWLFVINIPDDDTRSNYYRRLFLTRPLRSNSKCFRHTTAGCVQWFRDIDGHGKT